MAKMRVEEKPFAGFESVPGPTPPVEPTPPSVVVSGAAAHDPLAYAGRDKGVSLLSATMWAAATKLRPIDSAAFLSWARANLTGDRSAADWDAAFKSFQKLPVKG